MDEELEAPAGASELYLARATEIVGARPLMTGDVLENVEVPGLDDGSELGVVVTHPCSMRADGVTLIDRLLVARVEPYQVVPLAAWKRGHAKVMPLPELRPGVDEHLAARFDKIGLVLSASLQGQERIACLSPFGTNLLQQRLIWNLTRFVVPTHKLNEACVGVFEEADLYEEWVVVAVEHGENHEDAARAFHEWIRAEDDGGVTRQDQLDDPQRVSTIRKDLRREVEKRWP